MLVRVERLKEDMAPLVASTPQTLRSSQPSCESVLLDPRVILTSIQEAVYDWRLDSDELLWGANAARLLKVADPERLASGRAYAQLLDPDCPGSRYEAIFNAGERDLGSGVAYQVQYALQPEGRGSQVRTWIEDTGRWFAGAGGRPQRAHGVVRVVNECHAGERREAHRARFDELTGQMTRQRLGEVLGEMIEEARRYRTSLGLLLVAIENIGAVNATYGFAVADEVIAAVARRIRSCMRGGDGLGRYSGNKFGIIVNGCDAAEMPVAAQRFAEAISAETVPTQAGPIAVLVSAGGALAPRHARSAAAAMSAAQEALDACRSGRRRSFVAYAPSIVRDEQRRQSARLSDEILNGLNDKRLTFAYEPIVAAGTRVAAIHECLVRLRRDDGTLLGATAIVPMCERLGFIRLIDHRVLELAIEALTLHPEARLSMNLSAASAADEEWLTALALTLHRHADAARRLTVEITESAAMTDLETMRRFIGTMKGFGTRVAIDDFGAGYTSFRALRELDVDVVKIDGAFVQNMNRSSDDRFFVRTLIDLARHLGIETVAEWVQDEQTAVQLTEWGCDFLQGALIGRATLQSPWPQTGSRALSPAARMVGTAY